MTYYDSLTRPRIALVENALRAVGATFPATVTKARAEFAKITEASREYTPATRGEINAAVAAAFLDGRDPVDDEQVRRLVTSHALVTEAGLNVNHAAEARIVDAITARADEILDMLTKPAAEAGRALKKAHDLLGDESDPQVIIARGVDAVEAWTQGKRAEELLRKIDKAWQALAYLTGFAKPESDPVLRLSDATLEVFEKAGRKAGPWDIVRAGGTISLATRATLPERAQRIAEQRRNREDAQARGFTESYRRMHGIGASAVIH